MGNLLKYKRVWLLIILVSGNFLFSGTVYSQTFAPQVNVFGSKAIKKDSSIFINWATKCYVHRGFINISDTSQTYNETNRASFGEDSLAIGFPGGINDVVSLGDSGFAILSFEYPIKNENGYDFVVFENGILKQDNPSLAFLELAFVEVSSDSIHFFRFPAESETQFETQIGTFDNLDARNIYNLAGKYVANYGTPFDLAEIPNNSLFLDLDNIKYVKIIDVVGSIELQFASKDSKGNIINDPFPTPFNSCGFDLDAVGVIHQNKTISATNMKINVFPNPVKSKLSFYSYSDVIKKIEIIDLRGKLVFSENFNSKYIEIDVSNNQNGLYLVVILSDTGVSTKKLIIDK